MVKTRIAYIPASNDNRPGLSMNPLYITVHETANRNPGANAEMHRRFLELGGGGEGVSFHWCVDEIEAVGLVPENEVAWHAGDGYNGPGNRKSIGIETCVNSEGDWEQTLANLSELIKDIQSRHPHITVEFVVPHRRWSGKNCPTTLLHEGWDALIASLQEPKPDPNAWHFLETDKWVINTANAPILDFYKASGGKDLYGIPLTGLHKDEDGVYRQLFENVLIEAWPEGWGGKPGPHVRLGGLGQRYQKLLEDQED